MQILFSFTASAISSHFTAYINKRFVTAGVVQKSLRDDWTIETVETFYENVILFNYNRLIINNVQSLLESWKSKQIDEDTEKKIKFAEYRYWVVDFGIIRYSKLDFTSDGNGVVNGVAWENLQACERQKSKY